MPHLPPSSNSVPLHDRMPPTLHIPAPVQKVHPLTSPQLQTHSRKLWPPATILHVPPQIQKRSHPNPYQLDHSVDVDKNSLHGSPYQWRLSDRTFQITARLCANLQSNTPHQNLSQFDAQTNTMDLLIWVVHKRQPTRHCNRLLRCHAHWQSRQQKLLEANIMVPHLQDSQVKITSITDSMHHPIPTFQIPLKEHLIGS